jgi:hypothetical protein
MSGRGKKAKRRGRREKSHLPAAALSLARERAIIPTSLAGRSLSTPGNRGSDEGENICSPLNQFGFIASLDSQFTAFLNLEIPLLIKARI